MAELMPVIAQGQRRLDVCGKRGETPEMLYPGRIIQTVQSNGRRGPVVAPPQGVTGKVRDLDRAIEPTVKLEMYGGGAVSIHLP